MGNFPRKKKALPSPRPAAEAGPRIVTDEDVAPVPAKEPKAKEPEEIPIPAPLLHQLAPYQQQIAQAQNALNQAVVLALSAMGVEGNIERVEIQADPDRFVLHRQA